MGPTSFVKKAQPFNSRIARESLPASILTCANCAFNIRGARIRVLYAFDPRRAAVLLIGGDKTGADRWYEIFVPLADRLYDEHLADLEKEDHG